MVAKPILYRVTKMPPKRKGFQAAQKKKGQSGNPMFKLTPEALAGLEEQLAASVGMSGPKKWAVDVG